MNFKQWEVFSITKGTINDNKSSKDNKIFKKRYRGKGKRNSELQTFSIFLTNLRGFKSKKNSLLKLMKSLKPSMTLLNETQLVGKMEVDLEPYVCWTKNRSARGGGGFGPE